MLLSVTCTDEETKAEVTREVQTAAGEVTITGTAWHRTWRGCSLAAAPHAGLFCLLPGRKDTDGVTVRVAVPERTPVEIDLASLVEPDEAELRAAMDQMEVSWDRAHLVVRVEGLWRVYDFLPAGSAWLVEQRVDRPTTLPDPTERAVGLLADADFRKDAPIDFWSAVEAQPPGGPLDEAALGAWPGGEHIREFVRDRAEPGSGVSEAWRAAAEARAFAKLYDSASSKHAVDLLFELETPVVRLDEQLLADWPAHDGVVRMRLDRRPAVTESWALRMATKAGGLLVEPEREVEAASLIVAIDDPTWRRQAVVRMVGVAEKRPQALGVLADAADMLEPSDCSNLAAAAAAWPHYDGTWRLLEEAAGGPCEEALLPVALAQWPLGMQAHDSVKSALKEPSEAVLLLVEARLVALGDGAEFSSTVRDRVAEVRDAVARARAK